MSKILDCFSKTNYKNRFKNSKDEKSHNISTHNTFENNLVIQDLDSFFKNVYDYYYLRGYSNIITQLVLDNSSYLFAIHFFIFNIYIIDWPLIIKLCVKEDKCDLEISDFVSTSKIGENFSSFLLIYLFLIAYYLLFLWKSLLFLHKMKKMKNIYYYKLRIKQKEMENLKFCEIIERLIELQESENYCRIKENLTKFDVISRILRKENFLIAMITNNVIDLKLKIPLIGEKSFFTNFIYNNIYECIMKFAFEKGDTRVNPKILNLTLFRFKMIFYLLTESFFIPATIFFKIIFFIFRNADNFTSNKKSQTSSISNLSQKIFSAHSQILFRNYNELQHHFEYRINKSYNSIEKFMNCFKDRRISIFSKFFVIISGSFLILVFVISTIDNRLLTELKIFNKKIFFFAFVMGILISLFQSNANFDKNSEEDYLENFEYKDKLYKDIVNKVMNIPNDWKKSYNYTTLYKKISECYENNSVSLFKEIISISIFPVIWLKIILTQTKNIVKFFKFYVKDVNGIGMIYSYSYFDIQNFKFFKERDLNFNEWTFNDRKFLNSLIDYNVTSFIM